MTLGPKQLLLQEKGELEKELKKESTTEKRRERIRKRLMRINEMLGTANIQGAKSYFMARKMLKEKDFDNLFTVKPKPYVGREYKWWKEESTDLDDF